MREYTLKTAKPKPVSGFLRDLNAEQRRVVESGPGATLVIAGAGSGKTRTLTYRAAWLIEQGIDPERILLLTFTNRAAREMTERVESLLPGAARRMWAGTFHAIGNRVLRQHASRLGYGENYTILNSQEAADLMDLAVTRVNTPTTKRRFPKSKVLIAMGSSAVNTNRPLHEVIVYDHPAFAQSIEPISKILDAYLHLKVEMNAMDYDDLLVLWRLLLEDHPEARDQLAGQFQHILVDEYQDTNRLQADITRILSATHRNVMVVGDDCQSIYSFRGADVENILEFPKLYPSTQVCYLETNYRSTPEIVAVANRSITHNKKQFQKNLKAVADSGERPAFISVHDELQQAALVAQRVLELRDEGIDLGAQAVLYRAHYHALELQLELQRRNIPFVIRSGMRFFEQAHIRDVLAHIKVLFNPLDRLAWMRVLRLQDGIGAKSATRIFDTLIQDADPWAALVNGEIPGLTGRAQKGFQAARTLLMQLGSPGLVSNPASMLETILESGYKEWLLREQTNADARIEDIKQLAHFAANFEHYQAFLEELALVDSLEAESVEDGGPVEDEKLVLTTIHQSKGLEWDAVYVLHLSDGQFPMRRALGSVAEEEEERRLFYVAVTRARRYLHLCFPRMGSDRDRRQVLQRPSRFLAELPHQDEALMETWRVSES